MSMGTINEALEEHLYYGAEPDYLIEIAQLLEAFQRSITGDITESITGRAARKWVDEFVYDLRKKASNHS